MRAHFARRKPALSEVEGDLGEPREVSRCFCLEKPRHNNRAFGSLPYSTARREMPPPFCRNMN
jgi:hypothetical protein